MKIHGRKIDPDFIRASPMEEIPCRLCDAREFRVLSRHDCIGLPVTTVICKGCGLIFINPRPTRKWYKDFYSSFGGHHHEYKQSGYTGDEKPIGWGFESARKHGHALAERLGKLMKPGVTIDVGSSEGGVLAGLRDVLNIQPIGIEPVPAEAEYATSRGIPTHAALIENIESERVVLPKASNIVCVKSLNHFLNPAYFLSWAWRTLDADGRLVLEVKNFRQQVRRAGRVRIGIQLDHPYMYVPETLSVLVGRAGFEVLFLDVDEGKSQEAIREQKKLGLPVSHTRLVARKTARAPFSDTYQPRPGTVEMILRDFRPMNLYVHYLLNYANIKENMLARIGIKQ